MIDIIGLLDELKNLTREGTDSIYDCRTQKNLKQQPKIIFEKYDSKLFHCDASIILTLRILDNVIPMDYIASFLEICRKYTNEIPNILLIKKEIRIRFKRDE